MKLCFSQLFLGFSVFFLRFSLDLCKGRISKNTQQISITPAKIHPLSIFSVLTPDQRVDVRNQGFDINICGKSEQISNHQENRGVRILSSLPATFVVVFFVIARRQEGRTEDGGSNSFSYCSPLYFITKASTEPLWSRQASYIQLSPWPRVSLQCASPAAS